jgi:integrase
MPKVKLDNTMALTAHCPPGRKKIDYFCTIYQGLTLEVRASGGKTWYLRFTDSRSRQKQYRICRYGDLTVEQVRKQYKLLKSKVVLGGDPTAEREEKRSVPTYAELAEQHYTYCRSFLKRPENTEAVLRNHLLPRWGKMRLDEIKSQDIAKWFSEMLAAGYAPSTVEKMRVTFNRSFELAAKWGLPGGQYNPVRHVPRRKFNNVRERYLSSKEAEMLLAAASVSENTQLVHIVGLLLATGARKSELFNAQWQNVDLERRSWYIPDTKTGKPRHVPLSNAAMDIIQQLPRWDGCPWLIPNPATLKPFDNIKRAWDTARTLANLPGFRLHDLRHSAASFMVNAGVDIFAIGRVLGHSSHASTMRYAHLSGDTLRQAVEAGGAKMQSGWAQTAPV